LSIEEGGKYIMKVKAFKNITLTLLISSALACGGMAQTGNQLAPQKGRKKEPERPVEKKKNDDRGGDKRDEGGKKGKKP
jgi:hypothetical protein